MKKYNKNFVFFLSLGLILILIGVSYAFFTYSRTGIYTQTITGGKMSIIYNEVTGNNIVIDNAYPLNDMESLTESLEFEFTITGYNESKKNVYYAIEIVHGEDVSGKNRFLDNDMKLSLYENNVLVIENEIYNNLNKQDLYYGYIRFGTSESMPTVNDYRLRIWINDNVLITNTPERVDTENKHIYTTEEFSNCYANFKINVTADLTYDDIGYLTYDANGGEYTPEKTSLTINKITTQKPVLANKGFLGWSSDPLATTPEYKAGDSYNGRGQVLYAVYGDTRNVMSTFPTEITDLKDNITEIYFINDKQTNIDTRYGDSLIKADLTYNGQGSVKCWLENDYLDESADIQYYKLYIGSEGTTYLTTGNSLFSSWSKLTSIDFTNIDTSSVTDMSSMFFECSSLTNLDLSNFTFDSTNLTSYSNIFSSMPSTAIVQVKSVTVQSWILTLNDTDRPSVWTIDNIIIKTV